MELDQEKYLIERVQKYRDSDAFAQLYDKYYQSVLRFLLYRTGDEDLAKDLTSETFFQAIQSIWRFQWQSKPFSAWLFRIAHNQLLVYLRKNKHYCQITNEEAPELLEKNDFRHELMLREDEETRFQQYQTVRESLKHLNTVQQSVIVMRFFSQKSLQEIADILHLPLGTVKSHVHRALKRLGEFLKPQENVEISHEYKEKSAGEFVVKNTI